jgi:hypothetical protein
VLYDCVCEVLVEVLASLDAGQGYETFDVLNSQQLWPLYRSQCIRSVSCSQIIRCVHVLSNGPTACLSNTMIPAVTVIGCDYDNKLQSDPSVLHTVVW